VECTREGRDGPRDNLDRTQSILQILKGALHILVVRLSLPRRRHEDAPLEEMKRDDILFREPANLSAPRVAIALPLTLQLERLVGL
jgi:hypothetical protein